MIMPLRAVAIFLIFISISKLNFAACEDHRDRALAAYTSPSDRNAVNRSFKHLSDLSNGLTAEGINRGLQTAIRQAESQRKIKASGDSRDWDGSIAFNDMEACLFRWRQSNPAVAPPSKPQIDGGQQRPDPVRPMQQSPQSVENANAQMLSQTSGAQKSETQASADQQRQGKRKTNDPAAQAHECIAIDKAGSGNYGAFKNQCPYPVNFTTCNEKPRIIQGGFNWSADFDCAKQQFGLHTPKGNSSVAAHNRNTEFVYWFACKAPAMPVDATYAAGKGIEARCHN